MSCTVLGSPVTATGEVITGTNRLVAASYSSSSIVPYRSPVTTASTFQYLSNRLRSFARAVGFAVILSLRWAPVSIVSTSVVAGAPAIRLPVGLVTFLPLVMIAESAARLQPRGGGAGEGRQAVGPVDAVNLYLPSHLFVAGA